MYETIVVATDGSQSADRAVDYAVDLASTFDAELCVVSVVDTRRYGDSMLSGDVSIVESLERRGTELLEDVQARTDVEVSTELRRGRPHGEIAGFADENDADLIVLGNRGLGSSAEIGSTAERVVRYVDRPVLTV
ncbi:universal stress protein [Natrarchaeobaculum sulfurireducens]|uniref:Nucleotide-binding protein, UspA family n=1 Tax=Natrarchaeobaculum sulfurireducens TaxID=2044521 RepID=A0A346PD26_9EURY|nr:universal stress protein [Natrarchaeobaculum sulfurireducens]AXR77421.1 Nucleotide-binding protein, UspA family [Natrarchaeobaculum sulfurireducens]